MQLLSGLIGGFVACFFALFLIGVGALDPLLGLLGVSENAELSFIIAMIVLAAVTILGIILGFKLAPAGRVKS